MKFGNVWNFRTLYEEAYCNNFKIKVFTKTAELSRGKLKIVRLEREGVVLLTFSGSPRTNDVIMGLCAK